MQKIAVAAIMAAVATLAGAQGPDSVATKSTVVVVDLFPAVSTSTQYLTSLVTVLGCPPWETACPVRQNSVAVVTLNTAISTTVCPLTMTSFRLSEFSTTVASSSPQSPAPPLSTTTTIWPTSSMPSFYSALQSSDFSIDPSVWDSVSGLSFSASGYNPVAASSASGASSGAGPRVPSIAPSATSMESTSASPQAGSSSANTPPSTSAPVPTSPLATSPGSTYSTIVSAHTAITTISGPSGQSVSISTGSVTAIVNINTTSIISNYIPVTFSSNTTTLTYPNATYMTSAATANATGNGTQATPSPTPSLYTSSGAAAPANLFSIFFAIIALALGL